jgi:flagellar hook protein FlgE
MMRSLFAGVSGLRNHQVRMDVIGNNIANVNTVGYKASRVTFEEAFAQLVQGASRPPGRDAGVSGGTNPIQVGLGMNISSIDLLFTQGNLETTGVTTDLAIQGNSFFVVSDGTQRYYTRSGNFQLDANGRLVAATNGYVVQGRMADALGNLTDEITDIILPFGKKSPPRQTETVILGGNLNGEAPAGATRETTITVYDAQGAKHELTVRFTKRDPAVDPNTWDAEISISGAAAPDPTVTIPVRFNPDGTLAAVNGVASDSYTFTFTPAGFTTAQDITLDFGTIGGIDGLSQAAGASTVVIREQDGYPMGDLQNIGIDPSGTISGSFTNGVTLVLAQIVLADFNNPSGLLRSGDNMYSVSANSGSAVLGFAGEGSQSVVTSGALEMSNVDLAQEFTSMITAQRGYQSNARVISTSDEMLQEVVNLKR